MKATDVIRKSLETSEALTLGLIDDMKNAPFALPSPKGANHPLWILGHITYTEANIVNHVILGNENPLIGWKDMFAGGGAPSSEPSDYLSWDEVRSKFDEVRAHTLSVLEGLSDDDLDKPSKNCPPGREHFLGTVGGCFVILSLHPAVHRGQVADARRMDGREPLFA